MRQLEIMKQNLLQVLDIDLGLHEILARLIARLVSLAGAAALRGLPAQHIADLAVPIALADMLLLAVIVNNPVFVKTADRHFHNLLAIRHDDILFRHQIGQVALDRFPDFLLVALLILVSFAVQGPVLLRHDE
ncbi:hypothetical protein D3C71_1819630 [compost metagenome]